MDTSFLKIEYLEMGALAGFFLALMSLGFLFPLRRLKLPWLRRAFVNFAMSAAAFVVGSFVVRPVSFWLAGWIAAKPFGLLHIIPLPSAVRFVAGFLLLDLTFYYWHRANHEVALLWRFHNVHHIDPDLDVTTSFRFHFVEVLYSTLFRIVQVALIGVAPLTYLAYEFLFQSATVFHHSNMRLPIRAERLINRVFVTPRMHGIHHSDVRRETDSNYSVIFRWWDALHRTMRLNVNHSSVNIGVAGYQEPEDNGLWNLLGAPFRKQKEYWRRADGTDASLRAEEYEGSPKVLLE